MLVFAFASVVLSANTPPIAKNKIRADASTAFEIKAHFGLARMLNLHPPDISPLEV
jgi:hypothetical protein